MTSAVEKSAPELRLPKTVPNKALVSLSETFLKCKEQSHVRMYPLISMVKTILEKKLDLRTENLDASLHASHVRFQITNKIYKSICNIAP